MKEKLRTAPPPQQRRRQRPSLPPPHFLPFLRPTSFAHPPAHAPPTPLPPLQLWRRRRLCRRHLPVSAGQRLLPVPQRQRQRGQHGVPPHGPRDAAPRVRPRGRRRHALQRECSYPLPLPLPQLGMRTAPPSVCIPPASPPPAPAAARHANGAPCSVHSPRLPSPVMCRADPTAPATPTRPSLLPSLQLGLRPSLLPALVVPPAGLSRQGSVEMLAAGASTPGSGARSEWGAELCFGGVAPL
jgi:hypothetical protein